MKYSRVVESMKPSGIRLFFDLVLAMDDVLSLGVGEPDFPSPWNIREAALYSIEQGYTSYTSNLGILELRQAIAGFLRQRHAISYDPASEIIITVGVSEALDLVMRALLNPGDEVVVPSPCYVSYEPTVLMAGGVAVPLSTSHEDGFKIKPQELEKLITKKTKALLINYPCNPTGASYTRQELEVIAEVCAARDILIISDEIYDELTYDFDHAALPSIPAVRERCVYLNGFSKAYAMTGWRIGYACGPKDIIGLMTKIHQYTILCAPITSQMAAFEALSNYAMTGPEVLKMKREYARRRNLIVDGLNKIGFDCRLPEGAFYAFPRFKKDGIDGFEFSKGLLENEKVAVVPGTAFGEAYTGYLRMSYASGLDNIREALVRIERYMAACGYL